MLTFLKEACSLPWETMEFGAIESMADDMRSIRCNHVYIGCQRPFLIAAESVDSSSGVEIFGVVVIRDPEAIQTFIDGPYPPYNRPVTSSLQQLIGESSEKYLKGHKELYLTANEAPAFESMVRAVTFEGDGLRIRVSANDEVPMGLLVSWQPLA